MYISAAVFFVECLADKSIKETIAKQLSFE